ncbi:acyltransferase [Mesorhizobium sp. M0276]|uniref:acyltransferase family protein n=1 Tax=Mesorhizobium sp. M0276 TaxID=2956928 RepID=UPI003334BE79
MQMPAVIRATSIAGYKPQMDGLRAVACLVVVLLHMCYFCGFSGPTFQGVPKIGVWLFFVLSAFLLTLQLLNGTSLRDYAIGRALRILPPFVLAVAFYRVVGTLGVDDWNMVLDVLTFRVSAGHLWTIPPELTFYLVLPVLLIGSLAVLDRAGIRATICAIIMTLALLAWAFPPADTPENSMWFGWYAITFMAGIAAALAVKKLPIPDVRVSRRIGVGSLAVLLIYATVAKVTGPPDALVNKHFVFGPLLALITYSVFLSPPRFLCSRLMVSIGQVAYSTYLLHWAVGMGVSSVLSPWVALPIGVIASVTAGWIGYQMVERPTYALRHRLFHKKSPQLAATG